MKIAIIVQARLKSTRFPYKLLKKISWNKTSIEYLAETMNFVKSYFEGNHEIIPVFAMPVQDFLDIKFPEVAKRIYKNKCNLYLGEGVSEDNVYARVLNCANLIEAKLVVELTADCPFVNRYELIQNIKIAMYDSWKEEGLYGSNVFINRFVPDGQDIQFYTIAAMNFVYNKGLVVNNNHVGWNIYKHVEDKYKQETHLDTRSIYQKLCAEKSRITLDTKQDLKALKQVKHIYKKHLTEKDERNIFYMKLFNKKLKNKNIIAKEAGQG